MELHLEPELAAEVEQWSAQTGRPAGELVEDAIAGYFRETRELRATLDRRYDDIVNGKVKPLDGPEAVQRIKERAAARRESVG
jgi:hypothetical protein